MLAQVVDDPWDGQALVEGCPARDWVWATREEAAQRYLGPRLGELAGRMLEG